MSTLQTTTVLDKVRSRGYWRVVIRPTAFQERRVPGEAEEVPVHVSGEEVTFVVGPDKKFKQNCLVVRAAYTAGKLFGRHPLRSNISPRKTWEGSLGGEARVGMSITITRAGALNEPGV